MTLSEVKIETEDQRNLYALGSKFGSGLKSMELSEAELLVVARGFSDAARGENLAGSESAERANKVQEYLAERKNVVIEHARKRGKAYYDEFLKSGAKKTNSGLAYQVVIEGTGPVPLEDDMVLVNYKGMLIDGTVYASSMVANSPTMISLQQMISGWAEGMRLMKVGGKMKFVIPPELAFGDSGAPPKVPGGSFIVLEVELKAIPHHPKGLKF